ncbi:MAG: hypothetical protein ABSC47_00795, partial [Terracidiphilus sp.]
MYTARWLRGAARLIASESSKPKELSLINNDDRQLYILGANLRLSIKNGLALKQAGGQGGTYKVGNRCPLLFSKSPLGPGAPRCGSDGKQSAAFEWLDRLDRLGRLQGDSNDVDYRTVTAIQQLAAASVGTAAGKPSVLATLVRDEVEIMLAAWGGRADLSALSDLPDKIESGKNNVTLDTLSEAIDKGKSALEKMPGCLAALSSGLLSPHESTPSDYEDLCRYKDDLEKVLGNFKTSVGRMPDRNANFLVSDDARKAAIRGLLRTIAGEQKDVGYTIVNPATDRKILVIGVVGQDTMKAVSETNLHLCGAVQADNAWPADFADCHEERRDEAPRDRITASVEVVDPVLVTEVLIRAASLQFGEFERIVVMAQMPHTDAEVLATRVWARLRAVHESAQVDIVLSEAQAGYDSPNITLSYPPGKIPTAKRAMVLTPVTSYSPRDGIFPGAVSRATIKSDSAQIYSIANQSGIYVPAPLTGNITTVSLLLDLMTQLQDPSSTPLCANSEVEDCRVRTVMMLMESLQKAAKPRADAVLLQSRDYLLDKIEEDYTDYTMCGEGDHKDIHYNLCKLRVALDRILWKGDYIEFVAVTGKDLKTILDLSKSKSDEQASLLAKDITGEWLISYGIVQSPLSNLTQINQNNEPLWIPVDPGCKGEPGAQGGAKSTQSVYCIGGTPIANDSYYWVLTTDQLAEDKAVYGTFEALPAVNHKVSSSFVTRELAHYLHDHLQDPDIRSTLASNTPKLQNPSEFPVISINGTFQQQPLWQVDFAKTVASFTAREPVGGNSFVASSFQGASDARASAPSQQELDLELASRITGNFPKTAGEKYLPPGSIGIQSGFAYDRALLGNLSPKSKIVNPSYTLNNLTV